MKKLFFILTILLLATRAHAQIVLDPSIGDIGARGLGAGRAFVAASGEADSIFMNPASLAYITNNEATFAYSKFQNQADYWLLGAVTKNDHGTFGLGYQSSSTSGVVRDPVSGALSLQAGGSTLYNNNLLISFARRLDPNYSIGMNGKLLFKGFGAGGGTAFGIDADLGMHYRLNETTTIGFMQKNLFASLGSKYKWSDDKQESIPNASRIGLNYHRDDYNVGVDYEFFPASTKKAMLMVGGEWNASPKLIVRGGFDQSENLRADPSFGFSLFIDDYKFDYAFHQYGSSLNTSVFSLSYGIPHPAIKEAKKELVSAETKKESRPELLQINEPADRSVVFEEVISIQGTATTGQSFTQTISLSPGKNTIKIKALAAEKNIRLLYLRRFNDVPAGYWGRISLSVLSQLNILPAYRDGTFKPEKTLTRRELFNLLLNLSDMSSDFPAISPGDIPSQPDDLVTRAAAVSALVKYAQLPVSPIEAPPFADVPGRYWAVEEIAAAKQAGMLSFITGKSFEPEKKITRAEIGQIILKLRPVSLKVQELLDFGKGYE